MSEGTKQSFRIADLLTPHDDWIDIDPDETYREVTVRMRGRGVALRGELPGAEIGSSTRNRVRSGLFIISKIDARHGACGFVPDELDGAVVTGDFPVFEICEKNLSLRYFSWLTKTDAFAATCRHASEGSTNRVRLKMGRFLAAQVSLPLVEEQEQIASKLQGAADRMAQVRNHRSFELEDIESLLIRAAHRQDLSFAEKLRIGWREIELGEVITLARDPANVRVESEYPNLGIYCFGKGLFDKPPISGAETSATTLFRVKEGQFIYSRLFAFERAYAIVPEKFDGFFVSGEFPVFDLDADRVTQEFLYAYFRSPLVWQRLLEGSKGLGSRRIRVHPEQLLAHRLLLPPLSVQSTISGIVRRTNEIKSHAAQITADLDALERSLLAAAFRGELSSGAAVEPVAVEWPSDDIALEIPRGHRLGRESRVFLEDLVFALLALGRGRLPLERLIAACRLLSDHPRLLKLGARHDAALNRAWKKSKPQPVRRSEFRPLVIGLCHLGQLGMFRADDGYEVRLLDERAWAHRAARSPEAAAFVLADARFAQLILDLEAIAASDDELWFPVEEAAELALP